MWAVSGLQTEAGTVVVLAPDWRRPLEWLPPLAAYVVAAPLTGDTCMALDARGGDLDGGLVATLVERACGYLSEGAPFAEVLLFADDADFDAERVTSAAELVDRLGLDVRPLRDDPGEVVLHARWAKALVDDLQGELDRALLAAAPPAQLGGEPLVTVRIPTYGSVDLLLERAIPSVLAGAYRNVELLVCSDGPQPHARAAVEALADPRIRYLEVPERPHYPSLAPSFWKVAGTSAVNRLVEAARGEAIAPLDHDDAFTVDHIPVLLAALRRGADFAYGQAMTEMASGAWGLLGSAPLAHGHIVHASVMYTRRLFHMRYDPDAWLWNEPGDWNLWRRMREAGAEIAHVPSPVAVHFREGSSIAGREQDPRDTIVAIAHDLRSTPARALLEIASHTRGAAGLAGPGSAARARRSPAGDGRRLAVLDSHFPPARHDEAAGLLERRPDTVFFTIVRTGRPWPRPVYPLSDFGRLADELEITDVAVASADVAAGVLGLRDRRGARDLGRVLAGRGIRVHVTLHRGSDPKLLHAVADRCATVFADTDEAAAAVPQAIRIAVPVDTDFYAFRPRERGAPFRFVVAADQEGPARYTALEACARLGERFHLHVVGPHEDHQHERVTLHGSLDPADLRGLFWACDAFVADAVTATACEALASGCALVAAHDEHGIEDVVEVGEQDADALVDALRRLEADRDLRDRLAERGAARVREVMDVRRVVDAKLRAMDLAPATSAPG
jgi:glycosyltransferase involved in cell wall biosynthesis